MTTSTIVPYLSVTDARAAIVWYGKVFGATVVADELYAMDDGRIGHATLNIGDAALYLSDEHHELGADSPHRLGGTSVAIVLQVGDTDDAYETALANGATGQRAPSNQMGFRSAWFLDPWGHRWSPTSAEKPQLDEGTPIGP